MVLVFRTAFGVGFGAATTFGAGEPFEMRSGN